MENILYPPSPVGRGPETLSVSKSFRRQVGKVIGSITLFIIVYLLLIVAAIGLAIACCWLGVQIIIAFPKFITLLIGLGLMGVGVSVIVFLVKFIFAVSKDEDPRRVEVTEDQHPRLFAFIRRLTSETNTPFPKKIYVTPDVNAAVFYNSSFWSMFLPVRKNLEIGLGLVNSINISEFRAVMAHEFGHFSQRSMKLGSFTYNVNKVIHNMLYENNSYTNFLSAWGNIHGALSVFAAITVKIATGIQWILKGMYTYINKNYLGLSREMEFHADAVAASVSGGNNVISALSRIEVADNCYATALNEANDRLKENKIAKNIFADHRVIFRSMATEYHLPVKEGLPEISYHFVQSFSGSRINYKNQWASHPTLEERKSHLDTLGINATPDDTPAWSLFQDPETLQEHLTGRLYHTVTVKDGSQHYDGTEFEAWYRAKRQMAALPAIYKGFYDRRLITIKDWDPATINEPAPVTSMDELFNEETGQLQSAINNNQKDLELVKAIKDKRIDVTSFDFDGVKVNSTDADTVITQLEKDLAAQESRQQSLDRSAFLYFLHHTQEKERLRKSYVDYQALGLQYDEYHTLVTKTMKTISPFYSDTLSLEQVNAIVATLKTKYEPALKEAFKSFIDKGLIHKEAPGGLYDRIGNFSAKDYHYFVDEHFMNNELDELRELAVAVTEDLHRTRFSHYKNMLEQQLAGTGHNPI